MEEIAANDYNLNISRCISTALSEPQVNLDATHGESVDIEKVVAKATSKHNEFLKNLTYLHCHTTTLIRKKSKTTERIPP